MGKPPYAASTVNNNVLTPANHNANHGKAKAPCVPDDEWARASSSVAAATKADSVTALVGHGSDGWDWSAPSSTMAAAMSSFKMKSAPANNAGWDKTKPTSNSLTSSNQNNQVAISCRSVSDVWSKVTPYSNMAAAMSSPMMTSPFGNNNGWGTAVPSSNIVTTATKSNQGTIFSCHVSDRWSKNPHLQMWLLHCHHLQWLLPLPITMDGVKQSLLQMWQARSMKWLI